MKAKHVIIAKSGTERHKDAMKTLTFVGKDKSGRDVFSDLGLKGNWSAYRKLRAKSGL